MKIQVMKKATKVKKMARRKKVARRKKTTKMKILYLRLPLLPRRMWTTLWMTSSILKLPE